MTTTTVPPRNTDDPSPGSGPAPSPALRLWNRKLERYPDSGPRWFYLGITVLATIILYYELYVGGAVATQIIRDFGFSFTLFVMVSVVGNAVGAFASLFAGLADRWGRANLVVWGLLVTGLIVLVGIPRIHTVGMYFFLLALLSFVEGMVLVATPALIRDFSPQVGRGSAMGFWTLGPVLGSLVVTEVASHTLPHHPDWRFQFYICGIAGLVVFVIALLFLRELSPRLRDQLMVTLRDRALIEARAAGIDLEKAQKNTWRSMLRFDILGSAFAISIYLLLYYILVGFAVVYFATVYGYPEAKANALANWYWITNAITLVVVGILTDRFRVRKPFMVLGTAIGLIGSILFALSATNHQSYYTIAWYFILSASGGGMAYVAWMAGFTETVEKHNPAATATGLAIWGWTIRAVVTISLAVLTVVVPATSILVDKAPTIQAMQAEHPVSFKIITEVDPATLAALQANPNDPAALSKALSQVAKIQGASDQQAQGVASVITNGQAAAAQAVDPATLAALQANPLDPAAGAKAVGEIATALKISPAQAVQLLQSLASPAVQANLLAAQKYGKDLTDAATAFTPQQLAFLKANGADVAQAAADAPSQWQTWWWVCVGGQILFLPFIFVMTGRWSPRRAREDEEAHEAMVERELAKLRGGNVPVS